MSLESSQEPEDQAPADDALVALTNILSGRARFQTPDAPDLSPPVMLSESERKQMLAKAEKTIHEEITPMLQQMSKASREAFLRQVQGSAMKEWGQFLS